MFDCFARERPKAFPKPKPGCRVRISAESNEWQAVELSLRFTLGGIRCVGNESGTAQHALFGSSAFSHAIHLVCGSHFYGEPFLGRDAIATSADWPERVLQIGGLSHQKFTKAESTAVATNS
jgi:hypothetical protein